MHADKVVPVLIFNWAPRHKCVLWGTFI